MVKVVAVKGSPGSAYQSRVVSWNGDLPEGFAQWIDRQTEWDRNHSFGVVCKFKPVREIINIARRLNKMLETGPQRAASGYGSFQNYGTTMREVESLIGKLYRRVNEGALEMQVIRGSRYHTS